MRINPFKLTLAIVGITYTIKATSLGRQLQASTTVKQLIEFGSLQFYIYAAIAIFLSFFAGICSGLTVGYMSISNAEMQLWLNSNQPQKQKISKQILQILNNHHLLLSTLLLSNALALQALPIFLDKIVPAYIAIFISTAAVVIFGQVLPQAFCTGEHKIKIGYYMSTFIKLLQCILYPFVKPIVYVLDKFIEHDEGKLILTHDKIKNLLLLHNKKQYGYRHQQIEMLQNCLDLRNFYVHQVMIPLDKVFMMEINQDIDSNAVNSILSHNYSKFPIYQHSRDNIVGFVKSKKLITIDSNNPISFKKSKIILPCLKINLNQTLLDTITNLKTKKITFAIVINDNNKCIGILTIRQIFEKIILKMFKDDDIRVNIYFSKQIRINPVFQAKQQD